MMAIFHDMIEKTMEVFMDDFSVFGSSFSTCLTHLEKMLKRCEDTNLALNWRKSILWFRKAIVLGHKNLPVRELVPTRVFEITRHQSPSTGGEASQRCLHFISISPPQESTKAPLSPLLQATPQPTPPPQALSQPPRELPPLSNNIKPLELIFTTLPTSSHPFTDDLEDLPPWTSHPPPPPTFESIEHIAPQPPCSSFVPDQIDIDPPPPYFPPNQMFNNLAQSLWINGPPPPPTYHHEQW
ncbi:hypothetical protein Tco_0791002 [Tanacetum coccineum]